MEFHGLDLKNISGIIAWRWWTLQQLKTTDGMLSYLCGANDRLWPQSKAIADQKPDPSNTAGLYAYPVHQLAEAKRSVYGLVELRGEIIEHEDNILRAERAKVLLLFATEADALYLRNSYGFPILTDNNPGTCLNNYLLKHREILQQHNNSVSPIVLTEVKPPEPPAAVRVVSRHAQEEQLIKTFSDKANIMVAQHFQQPLRAISIYACPDYLRDEWGRKQLGRAYFHENIILVVLRGDWRHTVVHELCHMYAPHLSESDIRVIAPELYRTLLGGAKKTAENQVKKRIRPQVPIGCVFGLIIFFIVVWLKNAGALTPAGLATAFLIFCTTLVWWLLRECKKSGPEW